MSTVSKEQIVESLKAMTLMEVADLVKQLEETFGVSAAAPVAIAAARYGTHYTTQKSALVVPSTTHQFPIKRRGPSVPESSSPS